LAEAGVGAGQGLAPADSHPRADYSTRRLLRRSRRRRPTVRRPKRRLKYFSWHYLPGLTLRDDVATTPTNRTRRRRTSGSELFQLSFGCGRRRRQGGGACVYLRAGVVVREGARALTGRLNALNSLRRRTGARGVMESNDQAAGPLRADFGAVAGTYRAARRRAANDPHRYRW